MLSPLRLKDKLFYGWVMAVAFLIVGTAILGIRLSFGVFFKSIESEFSLTRAATSMVFSAYMLLGCVFTFLAGWALDRYGPRIVILLMGLFTGLSLILTGQTTSLWQLFVTYSLLLAIGTNAMAIVAMASISRWFDKKRGLALGIAGLGGGLGPVVMAPFATFLISNFDWRMAYVVIGGIAWLIVIPLSLLLKKDPYEIGALPDGAKSSSKDISVQKPRNEEGKLPPVDLSLLQASRTSSFWLLMFSSLLCATCVFMVFTHLVPQATDIGISAGVAATILSLIGGIGIVGRVLWGILLDRIGAKLAGIICALLHAVAMVCLIWAHELWMFYLFALIWGLAYTSMGLAMAALTSDTFGLRQIGVILGAHGIGFGIGAAIGPAIGGLIFDVTNSYSMAFLIGAVGMLIATLLISLVRRETGRGTSSGADANP